MEDSDRKEGMERGREEGKEALRCVEAHDDGVGKGMLIMCMTGNEIWREGRFVDTGEYQRGGSKGEGQQCMKE